MFTERVREEMRQRPGVLVALVVCFGLALAMRGVGCVMVRNAEASVAEARASVGRTSGELEALKTRFQSASTSHRADYLRTFEVASLEKTLALVQEKLTASEDVSDPSKKTQLANEAVGLATEMTLGIRERVEYLELLDRSQEEFLERLTGLRKAIDASKAKVESIVAQGYFAKHFVPSERLRNDAQVLLDRATALLPEEQPLQSPPSKEWVVSADYLAIWRVAGEGIGTANESARLADRVPALAQENQNRTKELDGNLVRTRGLYPRAFAAAQHLERYVLYRCLTDVNRSNNSLGVLNTYLVDAQSRNDMMRQDFEGAARVLDTLAASIATADRVFVSAIDRWRDVESAVRSIPSDRSSADSAIDRAASHISAYDYNSQSGPENLLRDARAAFRDGDNLRSNDPLQSHSKFVEAKSLADRAHNQVDTSSRRSSSDDSFGSDSGFGGWDSSPGGLGGGGGGFGGDFGGPGGGDFGGPSGGSFGNGDF